MSTELLEELGLHKKARKHAQIIAGELFVLREFLAWLLHQRVMMDCTYYNTFFFRLCRPFVSPGERHLGLRAVHSKAVVFSVYLKVSF